MKAKRVLGILLSSAMVLTAIPATAMAAPVAQAEEQGEEVGTEGTEENTDAGEAEGTESGTESGTETGTEGETPEAPEEQTPVKRDPLTASAIESNATADEAVTYKVYLPNGYNEDQAYPTMYLMPYDGYSADIYIQDGIQARLDELMAGADIMDMVVVMPNFTAEQDYDALMAALVADVEADYSVIEDARYRGILGANIGGYMAFENAVVTNSRDFFFVGAHAPDLTSNANPWLGKGSVTGRWSSNSNLTYHWYYLDGPMGDAKTTASNSITTLGNSIISKGSKDHTKSEYAVLAGNSDSAYYLRNLSRSLNRATIQFMKPLFGTTVKCTPDVVTNEDNSVTATVTMNLKDAVLKYGENVPAVEFTVEFSDPASGQILKTATTSAQVEVGQATPISVTVGRDAFASGTSTNVKAYAGINGTSIVIDTQSIVNTLPLGTAVEDQHIDLMGNWYFRAYKAYRAATTDLDYIKNIVPETYEKWGLVHPALGWWSSDFDSSLNGNANYGGYAWYVRTFEVPADFSKENLLCPIGKFDEANEVYINGHLIGSNGMNFSADGVGTYDGSNPWDENCVYDLDPSFVNYGGTNTIAIRMCNSSGGGGWYEGPVGLYTKAAYNKVAGLPSVYASADAAARVKTLVAAQTAAIQNEDMAAFAATVSPEYFNSGYNKERLTTEVAGWMDGYSDIQITDTGVGVFEYNGLLAYQAVRKITGIKNGATSRTTIVDDPEYLAYYKPSNTDLIMYGDHSKFFSDKVTSKVQTAKKEPTFLVCLPEDYFDEGNYDRYQTLMLLHGINSQGNTYQIDKVDQYVYKAVRDGKIDPMIMIMPDDPTSSKQSWWRNGYEAMLTEEILPAVDERYRTIADERYRMIAGCSMGGGGSLNVGFGNPTMFSGIISFYGAFNYAGNAQNGISSATKDYVDQFEYFFACGNEDVYSFYSVQETAAGYLMAKNKEHWAEIDNGGHDNIFYLPRFIPSLEYMEARMYSTDDSADILSGNVSAAASKKALKINTSVTLSDDISDYTNTIVNNKKTYSRNASTGAVSSITNSFGASNETKKDMDLRIPVQIVVTQNGVKVANITKTISTRDAGTYASELVIPAGDVVTTQPCHVDVYASVLENTKQLASIDVAAAEIPVYTTGLYDVEEDGVLYYYVNGEPQSDFTGVATIDGQKYYVQDGIYNTTFAGLAKDNGTWVYVAQGTVDPTYTGMAKNEAGWWYFTDGKLDLTYTGMAKNEAGWWYLTNGRVDRTYTGMAKNEYGWWYITEGKLDLTYTGMAKNEYGWWYITDGKLDMTYTGLAKNEAGWWYFNEGRIDMHYTGLAKNEAGWWYMNDGKLDLTFNGMAKNEAGWWKVTNGKVDTSFTGMAKNDYGWWYLENGTVNFKYTGLGTNDYGTWYIKDGKFDNTYTGTFTVDDVTYDIVNGKVMGVAA